MTTAQSGTLQSMHTREISSPIPPNVSTLQRLFKRGMPVKLLHANIKPIDVE